MGSPARTACTSGADSVESGLAGCSAFRGGCGPAVVTSLPGSGVSALAADCWCAVGVDVSAPSAYSRCATRHGNAHRSSRRCVCLRHYGDPEHGIVRNGRQSAPPDDGGAVAGFHGQSSRSAERRAAAGVRFQTQYAGRTGHVLSLGDGLYCGDLRYLLCCGWSSGSIALGPSTENELALDSVKLLAVARSRMIRSG